MQKGAGFHFVCGWDAERESKSERASGWQREIRSHLSFWVRLSRPQTLWDLGFGWDGCRDGWTSQNIHAGSAGDICASSPLKSESAELRTDFQPMRRREATEGSAKKHFVSASQPPFQYSRPAQQHNGSAATREGSHVPCKAEAPSTAHGGACRTRLPSTQLVMYGLSNKQSTQMLVIRGGVVCAWTCSQDRSFWWVGRWVAWRRRTASKHVMHK